MARSTYIYVLTHYGSVCGTYTVKHELKSAAARLIPAHLYSEYVVTRYYDGALFSLTPAVIANLKDWMTER